MHPTMTAQVAAQRAEENVRSAAAMLPAQARLEQFDVGQPGCDDPTDNGPKGRVTPFVTYQVHGLQTAEYGRCLDLLVQWSADNNFVVLRDSRPDSLYLWVENRDDGFQLAVRANDQGQLYATSSAPCVWPDGVQEPEA